MQRVHLLGVEVDLCDLRSVYKLADQLINGTLGSPDATTMDGLRLPHGSPGTQAFSTDIQQDRWALSQKPGSEGFQRSWGWGLSGIRIPRIDTIILSAGMGGWTGIAWLKATKDVLLHPVDAVTWPEYKLSDMGAVAKSQLSSRSSKSTDEIVQPLLHDQEKPDEPPLGEVFCANIFGHYILAHELMPLLSRPASPSSKRGGKILWISSIEALDGVLDVDDIQGLKNPNAYEGTKRLTDLLSITAELPSVKKIAAPYFDSAQTVAASKSDNKVLKESTVRPIIEVTHPGIFASEILPLNFFLVVCYKLCFFIARWLGSPWHPIDPYKAAVAPVWLTLTDGEKLQKIEGEGLKKSKWGSATDTSGNERVMRTEVPGWGWDGIVGTVIEGERKIGRHKTAVELTKEAKEEFEILGGQCWTKMEELRKEWEDILGVKS